LDVSTYGVDKFSHLLQTDEDFRRRADTNLAEALSTLPLTVEERQAFLTGDMATLYQLGANTFLLSRIPRFLPNFVSRDQYVDRMRSVLSSEERAEIEMAAAAARRSR
jgi:Xaa-Pro aminopeptidase